MEETQKNGKNILTILGLIALMAALIFGIKLIFSGLNRMLSAKAGLETTYSLLNSKGETSGCTLKFWEEPEEEAVPWMETVEEEGGAHWLARQDQQEYILYLPGQDRALSAQDITATMEKEGGETTLVLRIRTPEGSEEVDPARQLLRIQSTAADWNGLRVRVIMDGRELEVSRLISIGGELYSPEVK